MTIEQVLEKLKQLSNGVGWDVEYNKRLLKPFKMGKVKRNNKTKVNVKGQDCIVFASHGRERDVPEYFTVNLSTLEEGIRIQELLMGLGVNVALKTFKEISISLTLAEANIYCFKVTKGNVCKTFIIRVGSNPTSNSKFSLKKMFIEKIE